jgi:hypothetical protein
MWEIQCALEKSSELGMDVDMDALLEKTGPERMQCDEMRRDQCSGEFQSSPVPPTNHNQSNKPPIPPSVSVYCSIVCSSLSTHLQVLSRTQCTHGEKRAGHDTELYN